MNGSFIKPLSNDSNQLSLKTWFIFLVLVIIIGGSSGYFFRKVFLPSSSNKKIISKTKAGIVDKKTFRDQAEGILREGGIDGEGSFHLERPGGESQNVYLTSSTVDLSLFLGKKVRVYGETFAGQKAGWLMDVGLVEVIK